MQFASTEPPSGFASFGLSASLLRGVKEAGFVQPRPIQTETIPAALAGHDILGLAQTGTGKTAAFALPILERLQAAGSKVPKALIVAPTRELAAQIAEEIRLLSRFTSLRTMTVFGGVAAQPQREALRRGAEIVVGCPGRLLDLLGQGVLHLNGIEILVLDEADHMFDMGFLPSIRRILSALPKNRQNLLFSATMPAELRGLAESLLSRPHVVDLNHSKPVSTVSHAAYPVDSRRKVDLLDRVLGDETFVSAIVFTRTKHRAKRLAQDLDRFGHQAVALQGNMSQAQRIQAMDGFRKRRFRVLVATDIAARGLDVEQVSHVVNFDMPSTADAYTHRIGRTGRAERTGQAISFITADDRGVVQAIERRIGTPLPLRAVDGLTLAAGIEPFRPVPPGSNVRSFRPRTSRVGRTSLIRRVS